MARLVVRAGVGSWAWKIAVVIGRGGGFCARSHESHSAGGDGIPVEDSTVTHEFQEAGSVRVLHAHQGNTLSTPDNRVIFFPSLFHVAPRHSRFSEHSSFNQWFFQSGPSDRSHYKVMHYSAIDRKIVAVKKFSSDAWRTATWELRRCVPVESFRFERRWPEKLGCRRWKV